MRVKAIDILEMSSEKEIYRHMHFQRKISEKIIISINDNFNLSPESLEFFFMVSLSRVLKLFLLYQ